MLHYILHGKNRKMISKWCNLNFHQLAETPLTSKTWQDILTDSETQDDIIDGTFYAPTDEETIK